MINGVDPNFLPYWRKFRNNGLTELLYYDMKKHFFFELFFNEAKKNFVARLIHWSDIDPGVRITQTIHQSENYEEVQQAAKIALDSIDFVCRECKEER